MKIASKQRYCLLLVMILVLAFAYHNYKHRPGKSLFSDYSTQAVGKLWTITGAIESKNEAFVSPDGSYQPGIKRYSIHYYVYDHNTGKLLNPKSSNIKRSLLNGYMPAPHIEWTDSNIAYKTTVFAFKSSADVCFSSVELTNTGQAPKEISLYAVVVPYGIIGKLPAPSNIEYDTVSGSITSDENIILSCDTVPDSFGANKCDMHGHNQYEDVTSYITKGYLPKDQLANASAGSITSCAVCYNFALKPGNKRTFTFKSPLELINSKKWLMCKNKTTYTDAEKAFVDTWSKELSSARLSLSDKRISDCFYANLAYLILLSDNDLPKPGATCYKSFWTRDFAYISDAFYYTGRSDLALPGIDYLLKTQLPNGRFKARSIGNDNEHDAQGQAIYSLVQYYRRTHDKNWLAKIWPSIKASANYIHSMQLSNKNNAGTRSGVLPPSISAEDLGRANQQHYWDDFWAIRGLRDAVYSAKELGHTKDASTIFRYADFMDDATWRSIKGVAREKSISYIPNGPDDVITSSMARGTSCALWPCDVLDTNDPFVRSSFDTYWNMWIAPNRGGFEHQHQLWAYAGMDLASGYLMLGERDRAAQILRWTINHDPTQGFYSWCEGMNKKNMTVAMGDMPHGWMCASYIALIRNMLVRESGDDIMLASGVPQEWLAKGKHISISGFPTLHGKLSYQIRSFSKSIDMKIGQGANITGHYSIDLPKKIIAIDLDIDGKQSSAISRSRINLPASTHQATIHIKRL